MSDRSLHDEATGERRREWGDQPIALILKEEGLKPHDLVQASAVPMTHKMVSRACKGRWLTVNTRVIVTDALNAACGKSYRQTELFSYR